MGDERVSFLRPIPWSAACSWRLGQEPDVRRKNRRGLAGRTMRRPHPRRNPGVA